MVQYMAKAVQGIANRKVLIPVIIAALGLARATQRIDSPFLRSE